MGSFTYENTFGRDAKALVLARTLGGGIELRHGRGTLLLSERECRWLLSDALPGLLAKIAEEPEE